MYVSYYGCDVYLDVYVAKEDQTPDNKLFWCNEPVVVPAISTLYWVSFSIISAMVMLSLFIGAVTMSMTEAVDSMKEEKSRSRKELKKKTMIGCLSRIKESQ